MTVKKYIQRVEPFEAVQWTGENLDEVKALFGDECIHIGIDLDGTLWMVISEAQVLSAFIGDFIYKDAETIDITVDSSGVFEDEYTELEVTA